MSSVVLCARLLLVLIFAAAAAAKFADLQASRDTVEAFGFPRRVARYGGTALPFAELAAAVALLPQASARWGAVAALALLVIFNAGVAYALSQGRTPDCNCFGQVSSEQISWRTLARNGVFVLIAAFAIWKAPGASLSAWTHNGSAANLVAAFAVIAAALLAVAAFRFRQLARLAPSAGQAEADAADVLPPGAAAPDFELTDLDGEPVTRDQLLERGLPLVLVFASPTCGPCRAMMPEIARWHAALNESMTLVVVESGAEETGPLREQLRALGDFPVLVDDSFETAFAYKARVTPVGIAVSADGTIASPPLPGRDQIEQLVRATLRRADTPSSQQEAVAGSSAS